MNDKNEKLNAVFGDLITNNSTGAPQTDTDNSKNIETSDYAKLKKKILSYQNMDNNPVYRAIEYDRAVFLCVVAKKFEKTTARNLQGLNTPFLVFLQCQKAVFVVKDVDAEHLKDAISASVLQKRTESEAVSHEAIQEYSCEKNEKLFYVKNVDEQFMELVLDELCSFGIGRKYSFFRMNSTKWGIAFPALYLSEGLFSEASGKSILESLLYCCIALNGSIADYNYKTLDSDIKAKRLFSMGFKPSLIDNPCVYITNPEFPNRAIKITDDRFSCVSVVSQGNKTSLQEENCLELNEDIGRYILNNELSHMEHKAIVYSPRELLEIISKHNLERDNINSIKFISHNEQLLAFFITKHFIEKYENEKWIENPDEALVQMEYFKKEVDDVFAALIEHECPQGYTERDGETLYAITQKARINVDHMEKINKSFKELDTGELRRSQRCKSVKEEIEEIKNRSKRK